MTTSAKALAWAELLAAQADSGLNKQDFCAERGINPATFYYWQRKLARLDDEDEATVESAAFTRLHVVADHELTICLPHLQPVTLRSASASTLAQVVKALAHA